MSKNRFRNLHLKRKNVASVLARTTRKQESSVSAICYHGRGRSNKELIWYLTRRESYWQVMQRKAKAFTAFFASAFTDNNSVHQTAHYVTVNDEERNFRPEEQWEEPIKEQLDKFELSELDEIHFMVLTQTVSGSATLWTHKD